MFLQRNRCKPHLSGINTLVFHHTAVFLLLTHCCEGQSQAIDRSKPIVAMVGDDIILPCHLETATDVAAKTLEWARLDLNPRFVHLRRDGVELLVDQHPSYIGRTSLSPDKLKHGDISLKLSKVKLSDDGTYRCFVPPQSTSVVKLVVGATSPPVVIIAEIDKSSGKVVLQCESKGWYPQPEVFWLDGEGNLLSAEPTKTVRGPDGLYTVSSRVTVEKKQSNIFTCRVEQNNINQSRTTEIHILENVFTTPSCSAVRITVVLISCVGFMVFSAVFLVLWKRRQNNINSKMQPENETGKRQQLIKGSIKLKNLTEEKAKELHKKEKEKEDMSCVITVLNTEKNELEISRDKWKSQLEETLKERGKKEKKLEKIDKRYSWDSDQKKASLLSAKQELEKKKEDYQNTLNSIVERLKNIEDMITRMTERKMDVEEQLKLE
ncbi:butyrophilin subfamily 1 member A1-like [Scomber scombrus]|uniref:butyrophilin subfamily 1 member A1-like n=1 Tax=Scomber scombrus TaxID=13677 RepID=UPI002DDBD1C9|nr:butyrophilin subfamily 1 member A1-like [Scomber scombrus]